MRNFAHIALPPRAAGMKKQSGVMLLEALIAVLIFSLGVLTLVALQATSIRLTGDARYRASAAIVVERLFSEMRISGLDATALETAYASALNGPGYQAWKEDVVESSMAGLLDPTKPPAVSVAGDGTVRVTVAWRVAPDSNQTHTHTAVTQIR